MFDSQVFLNPADNLNILLCMFQHTINLLSVGVHVILHVICTRRLLKAKSHVASCSQHISEDSTPADGV